MWLLNSKEERTLTYRRATSKRATDDGAVTVVTTRGRERRRSNCVESFGRRATALSLERTRHCRGERMSKHEPSLGEEIANAITHGAGLLASLIALPVLIWSASRSHDGARITGATIFGVTLCLLYTASTLYHSFPSGRTKRVFRVLDHGAIYLLIAGTYTPFAL